MKNDDLLMVCGGCNAKIGPGDLGDLLSDLPKFESPNLLVGFDTTDDAAVMKLRDDLAIIQTVDFFPTMVSNPYTFGKIAAANALSDVYAMGGTVLSALNIVAYPEEKDLHALKEILRGGAEKVQEAGAVLCGGHSIHDHSVKYGLAVVGTIDPNKIYKNNTCEIGDHLILTKPLGVSILTAGYMAGEVDEAGFNKAVESMETLNKYAADVLGDYNVTSVTDVTGFGLLGHLREMLDDNFSAEIHTQDLPIFDEALKAANEFVLTAGGQRNRNYLAEFVEFQMDNFAMEEVLFDPQTSGGLLISVNEADAENLLHALQQVAPATRDFGRIIAKNKKDIYVTE